MTEEASGGAPVSTRRSIDIPSLVRIKPGALDRIGIYLARRRFERAALFHSQRLPQPLVDRASRSLENEGIDLVGRLEVRDNSVEARRSQGEDPTPQTPRG